MAETQVYDGVNVILSLEGTDLLGQTDAKVTISTDLIPGTHKGTTAGNKKKTPGRSELKFECDGMLYVGGGGASFTLAHLMNYQLAKTELDLIATLNSQDTIACKVYLNETGINKSPDSGEPTYNVKGESSGGDSIVVTEAA